MTEPLADQISRAQRDGYEIVQRGRVLAPTGRSFADRVEGFRIERLGPHSPPDYRSPWDNLLLDDAIEWVHLRRDRDDSIGQVTKGEA